MPSFRHWHVTVCPQCTADLTRPESVRVHLVPSNGPADDAHTSVDPTGELIDINDRVAAGDHAGSWCAACNVLLDDLDDPAHVPAADFAAHSPDAPKGLASLPSFGASSCQP